MKNKVIFTLLILLAISASLMAQNSVSNYKISDNCVVVGVTEDGVERNAVIILGKDKAIVVDTFSNPVDANLLRRIVKERYEKEIEFVFNTHFIPGELNGNQVFNDVTIIGHSNLADALRGADAKRQSSLESARLELTDMEKQLAEKLDKPEQRAELEKNIADLKTRIRDLAMTSLVPPGRGISADASFELDGNKIHIMALPYGHTNADIVIRVENDGVLITGGLAFNEVVPLWDAESGATIEKRIELLDRLLKFQGVYTVVVPALGKTGGVEILAQQRGYLVQLLIAVKQARAEGKTLDQALDEIELDSYKHWQKYKENLPAGITAVWNWLEKKGDS